MVIKYNHLRLRISFFPIFSATTGNPKSCIRTATTMGVDPWGGDRSPKIWSGGDTNTDAPLQKSFCLCAFVHIML